MISVALIFCYILITGYILGFSFLKIVCLQNPSNIAPRHNKKANGLFADGHARTNPLSYYQPCVGLEPWFQNNTENKSAWKDTMYLGPFTPY